MRKSAANKNLANNLPASWREGRGEVGLKICGMKLNTAEVSKLRPDYLGFIFWEPSPRFFQDLIPDIDTKIKKVGVFVDAPLSLVVNKIEDFHLDAVQLHGNESPQYCKALREGQPEKISKQGAFEIIKVFSIMDTFNFEELEPYEDVCDYYLFDTKGKLPGGNGYSFNWKVLENYPSEKPFFLSGGIGLEELESVKRFMKKPGSKYCHAIDVNSRFEIDPGLKDIKKLKAFIASLNQ